MIMAARDTTDENTTLLTLLLQDNKKDCLINSSLPNYAVTLHNRWFENIPHWHPIIMSFILFIALLATVLNSLTAILLLRYKLKTYKTRMHGYVY